MSTDTRTTKQIAAADMNRTLTKAALEAFDFAVNYGESGMRETGYQLVALRSRVRNHMHPRDREETSHG
jgi:hypothetical protein